MRLLLILVCLCVFAGTAWFAIERGQDRTYLRGAAQVEALVQQTVQDAVGAAEAADVSVRVSGRDVTISGEVTGTEARDRILAQARGTRLVRTVKDRLTVIQIVSPFAFRAEKSVDGRLSLTGFVPTQEAEATILATARQAAGGASVDNALSLAAGAPGDDWVALASTGVTALGHLDEGAFELQDLSADLTGTVSDAAAGDAVASAIEGAEGIWTLEIIGLPPADTTYAFTALKTSDGAVIIGGNQPDPETGEALRAAAREISSGPVEGTLETARGMPSDDWPDLVRRGLTALAATDNGLLTISGTSVDLAAQVQKNADLEALLPLIGEDWTTEIATLNPPPTPSVTLALSREGTLKAAGLLPGDLSKAQFEAALPGTTLDPATSDEPAAATDWTPALETLNTALPMFRDALATIEGETLTLEGQLRRGLSIEGANATFRTALPAHWTLTTALTESAPLSQMVLSQRGDELLLSGVLPKGLDPVAALDVFPDTAGAEGLTTGGEGSSNDWLTTLEGTAEGLVFFTNVTGRITEGRVALDGTLAPGYTTAQVSEWIEPRVMDGWSVIVSAEEVVASEGATRNSLIIEGTETFRSGFWLPDLDFPVSEARCKVEVTKTLASGKINFITASARIDQKGRALLNRLASVAVRCLNGSGLTLEIAGHTDASGSDENNLKLSEARALAVLGALVERGVDEAAMQAVGYGEAQPIASNDTPEGRAQNRRIAFEWTGTEN